MPDPNQNQNNSPLAAAPAQSDMPPIPDFQSSNTSGGSPASSSDFFPPSSTKPPKKKFGTNRIVATILGVLLLVGGIGAGIVLVLQPQLLEQQAAGYSCPSGVSGYVCNDCDGKPFCNTDTSITCSNWRNLNCTGGQCNNDPHCLCGGCPSGRWCNNGTGTCLPTGGTGNCATNKGDCWVTTPIGVGPDGKVCDAGGHWTTCSPGYQCKNNDCIPTGGTPKPTPPKTPPPPTPPKTPTPTPRTPTPTPTKTPTPTPTPTPTSTPPGFSMACSNVKAYTSGWTLLSATQLKGLKPGNNVNFCVNGTASTGSFDKAKFTINGSVKAETTAKRPSSNDYCQTYTIPTGVTTFTVTAQIHHVTGGWVGP